MDITLSALSPLAEISRSIRRLIPSSFRHIQKYTSLVHFRDSLTKFFSQAEIVNAILAHNSFQSPLTIPRCHFA